MVDGKVRVAVIGGGAIGGFIAAMADAAGCRVTMCVRSPMDGLEVVWEGAVRRVPVRVISDPAKAEAVDWVFVTTKAPDTASTAPWFKPLLGPGTRVVVAQNGLGHEARVRPLVGEATIVVPMLVRVAAERTAPGRMTFHTIHSVTVPDDEIGRELARLCARSGVTFELLPDFLTAQWRKLIFNVPANSVTAITGRRLGVAHEPRIATLIRELSAETVAVGRAAGAEVDESDAEAAIKLIEACGDSSGTSMLYDRLAGRPMEWEYLSGAVADEAERLGVPAPVCRAITALLSAVDAENPSARG